MISILTKTATNIIISPLYKNGGWEGNRDEFNAIFRDILTTPKYYPRLIARETEATIKQFFCFETGATSRESDQSSVLSAIKDHWPENFKEFGSDRQQTLELDWRILNLTQGYMITFLFLCTLIIYFIPGFDRRYKMFLTFVLIALLVNAFVCGAISGVVDRYQSRVIWLLPLPFMLYLANREVTIKPLQRLFHSKGRGDQ